MLRRIGDGLHRGAARIGDRRRRQAVDHDRCCTASLRRSRPAGDRPVELALAADQAVDDGRIGLQPHLLVSRLRKTPATRGRSSARPVSFSTIEASMTSLLRRLERQVGRTLLPDLVEDLLLLDLHARRRCLARVAALEIGRCRAGACLRAGSAAMSPVSTSFGSSSRSTICWLVSPSGMVIVCVDRLALDQRVHHLAHAGAGLERVFAGLERVGSARSASVR